MYPYFAMRDRTAVGRSREVGDLAEVPWLHPAATLGVAERPHGANMGVLWIDFLPVALDLPAA